MKLYKYQFFIIFTIVLSISLLQFDLPQREDIIYIAQFLILMTGIIFAKENWRLKSSLLFLLIADIIYYLLVYRLGHSTEDKYVVLLSSFSYFISFNIFTANLLAQSNANFLKALRRSSEFLITCFFLLTAAYYILIPGIFKFLDAGLTYGHLSNAITLLSSLPLVIVCYVLLTNNNNIKNQSLMIGFFILGVLDIGIQLETIKYGNLKFSLYDIFCLFGVFFISYGSKDFFFKEEKLSGKKSIIRLVKNIFFISALVTVLIFSIFVNSVIEITPMYSIFILVSIFLFGVILSGLISHRISIYNKSIKELLSKTDANLETIIDNTTVEFSDSLFLIHQNIFERNSAELEKERKHLKQTQNIYRQMAHDIASPLTVLQSISNKGFIDGFSTEQLRDATLRVRSIAEDILANGNRSTVEIEKQNFGISVQEIKILLSKIIQEKKLEHKIIKPPFNIDLTVNIEAISNTLIVQGTSKELSRVVSNILNNSIEALPKNKPGHITIELQFCGAIIEIIIKDNGLGFYPEILTHDFDKPLSIGKSSGNGIGLFSAAKTLQKWGGKIVLKNHDGAVVSLKLIVADAHRAEEFSHLNKFLNESSF